jgi:hypothetical protein
MSECLPAPCQSSQRYNKPFSPLVASRPAIHKTHFLWHPPVRSAAGCSIMTSAATSALSSATPTFRPALTPPPGVLSNPEHPETLKGLSTIAVCTCCVLTSLFFFARCYCRFWIKNTFIFEDGTSVHGRDDWKVRRVIRLTCASRGHHRMGTSQLLLYHLCFY